MRDLPRIIHLITDLSLGGVIKNLQVFEQDSLTMRYISKTMEIKPEWTLAPQFGADIIITHFSTSWANLPFLLSLRKRNKHSIIIHMEHSYSQEWVKLNVPEIFRFRAMLKLTYSVFDKIICVSKAQSRWFESIGVVPIDKHHIINPWSELSDLFAIEAPKIIKDKPLTIGAYGRLVKEKGFEDLIQSFLKIKHNDNISLLIGGYGPDEKLLMELASDNPHIRFYGLVNDVADFVAQCDMIAVPSYFETYGLVATEARAAARPILVSPVGSLVEQINNSGQVIDFNNHQKAAYILSSLYQLPLEAMSKAARRSCQNIPSNIIRNWIGFLDGLLLEGSETLKVA